MSNWIVVADASKAIIYAQERPRAELDEVMDLVHPEATLKQQALASDNRGVQADAGNPGGLHGMAEKASPRAHEDKRFAKAIIARVRHALDTNEIRGFYLAAPPHFLGLLRDALDDHLRKALRNDLDKNLTHAPHKEIIAAFAFPTLQ
jgi:protein required for attachment to host cells